MKKKFRCLSFSVLNNGLETPKREKKARIILFFFLSTKPSVQREIADIIGRSDELIFW